MLRFVAGTNEPVYPIGFMRHKQAMPQKRCVCRYTEEGRRELHDSLRINVTQMLALMRQPLYGRSAEYADNRISLFSAQWGKCAVTGRAFQSLADIHCHHKNPRERGGSDRYENLVLVCEPAHRLIHATQDETIRRYMSELCLDKEQMDSLNRLRKKANLKSLT